MGMRIARFGHLLCDPSVGIPDRVWSLFSQPCLGPWVGLAGGSCCQNFGPCSPWHGRAPLRAFGRCRWPCSWTRSFLSLRGHLLSQEMNEVWRQVQFSTKLLICLKPDLLSQFLFFLWEVSHHHALSFESLDLCCNLRLSMKWWSWSSGWDHGGLGEGDWHQLGHEGEGICQCLDPLLPLKQVLLLPNWDCLSCCFSSMVWSSSSRPQECLWPLEGNLAGPLLPCRPAQVKCPESSLHSSFMRSLH